MRLPCAKGERFLPADRVTTGWSKLGRFGYALACFIFRFLRRPLSELRRLVDRKNGTVSVQTPETSSIQVDSQQRIEAGSTFVLSAYERDIEQFDKTGVVDDQSFILGQSNAATSKRERFLIVITPYIKE